MVFTSQIFLFYFLPLALGLYYLLPPRGRNLLLALASYLFYGWWSPWFVSLMLTSTVIDWVCGIAVTDRRRSPAKRRFALTVAIGCNLGLLGFFKYYMFAAANVNRLIEALGGEAFGVLAVTLPVGISFYTLQSMSYSIDLYLGRAQRAKSFVDFACYVSMFPQLIAGPIVRYGQIASQLTNRPQRGELFQEGVLTFMVGFAKKILLANTLAEVGDLTFACGAMYTHVAWFGAVAYTFQLYFDFSGYSDMAIGLGKMLGFRLPENFRSPYRACSISDIWRRWHISLGTWVRDYFYIPLGGSRGSRGRTFLNLWLAMVVVGIWHGAEWHYVLFGVVQGALLILERMTGRNSLYAGLPLAAQIFLTYVIWVLCVVLFRDSDVSSAWAYWGAMFGGRGEMDIAAMTAGMVYQPFYLTAMVAAALCVWRGIETGELVRRARGNPFLALGILGVFLLSVVAMFSQAENPFIYFQF